MILLRLLITETLLGLTAAAASGHAWLFPLLVPSLAAAALLLAGGSDLRGRHGLRHEVELEASVIVRHAVALLLFFFYRVGCSRKRQRARITIHHGTVQLYLLLYFETYVPLVVCLMLLILWSVGQAVLAEWHGERSHGGFCLHQRQGGG